MRVQRPLAGKVHLPAYTLSANGTRLKSGDVPAMDACHGCFPLRSRNVNKP